MHNEVEHRDESSSPVLGGNSVSADIEKWEPPNDPTAFESLCLDLWRDIWQGYAQKNGRSGQPQAGVDVFGQHQGNWIGVQCKQKDGLLRSKVKISELDEEVAAAKQFTPPLFAFILATTGPRDAALQQRARLLTEQHREQGLFTVEIWSWDDIWPELYRREQLFKEVAPLYWPRRTATEAAANTYGAPAKTSEEAPIPPEIKDKMEAARAARRRRNFPLAQQLWEDVEAVAGQYNDPRITVRARLEKAHLQLLDEADPDEALKTIEACLAESKRIDLGKQRARVLQLLGEVHRIKGNADQARGFLNSARECGRAEGDKCDEAWALLALAAIEHKRGSKSDTESRLELIRRSYDCFSALYTAGDDENQRSASEGFAACHSWRAEVLGYVRLDEAIVEYGRAMEVYSKLGENAEWEFADTLHRRGELQARADDAVLAAKDLIVAAKLFEKLGDHLMRARCVSDLAELLDRQGHRVQAKEYFKMAAQIALQQGNPRRAGGFLFRYACKLGELREFDQQKAILAKLLEADWLKPGQRLDILKILCLTAKATGEDDELKEYSDALLEILDDQVNSAKSAEERRRLILSKGHTLEDLEQHERALACYRRGIEACERANDRSGLIESWWCIAQAMGKTKKRKEERQAYEKILSLVGDKNDVFHFPMALTMLAQLDIMEERFEEARARLDRAEQENEHQRNPVVFLLVNDLRAKLPPTEPG